MSHASEVIPSLEQGNTPTDDGWSWLYRAFNALAPRHSLIRKAVCKYFRPSHLELAGGGAVFRFLGVHRFCRYLPTGGIEIRRRTGAKMKPYTLAGTSIRHARDFHFRICVFETFHFPFFLALIGLAVHRASMGRMDYALQESVMNLVVNLYPMLHHRHTRARIVALLTKASALRSGAASG